MAYYNKLKMGVAMWYAQGSSTNASAYPYDYTRINTTDAHINPGVPATDYTPGDVVRTSNGSFPTATYYWYLTDLPTLTNFYANSVSMDCVVINGVVRFGKMPVLAAYGAAYYSESSDYVRVRVTISKQWGAGNFTSLIEIGDSTPDSNSASVVATSTSAYIYLWNARATYGTGTKTVYVRFRYDNVYTNVVSFSVVLTAPSTKSWAAIGENSSEVIGDVNITYAYSSAADALDELESAYSANNRALGDIGIVYHPYNNHWLVCEVQ